jgi:response regulator RpfG family c-di-GMP phosphodiesterase
MAKQRGIHFDPACFDAFKTKIDTILKIQNMLPDVSISNYK